MKTVFITYKINTSTWPTATQLEKIKKEMSIKDDLQKIKGVGEVFEVFFAGDHEPDFQIRAIDFTDNVLDLGQFGFDGEVELNIDTEISDIANDVAFDVASELIDEHKKEMENISKFGVEVNNSPK